MRRAAQGAYLDWAVAAFRIATGGVADDTQIHTHLCYSEFGVIIDDSTGELADRLASQVGRVQQGAPAVSHMPPPLAGTVHA